MTEVYRSIFTVEMQDGFPAVKRISETLLQTLTLNGKDYVLVPADIHPIGVEDGALPKPPASPRPIRPAIGYVRPGNVRTEPVSYKELPKRIKELLSDERNSIEAIARITGHPVYMINKIIDDMGWRSPADLLREKFKAVLEEAGDKGVSPRTLSVIAGPDHRPGPIITSLMKTGKAKRLPNGFWATHP